MPFASKRRMPWPGRFAAAVATPSVLALFTGPALAQLETEVSPSRSGPAQP